MCARCLTHEAIAIELVSPINSTTSNADSRCNPCCVNLLKSLWQEPFLAPMQLSAINQTVS
jgi:hypothetical protein